MTEQAEKTATPPTTDEKTIKGGDVDQLIDALVDYKVETNTDATFIADKLAQLAASTNNIRYISEKAQTAIDEFAHDYITYPEAIRLAATQLLINIASDMPGKKSDIMDSLLISLADKNPVLRKLAVQGIGQIGFTTNYLGESALTLLSNAISAEGDSFDKEPDIEKSAISWIGSIGETQPLLAEKASNLLHRALHSTPHAISEKFAAQWLGRIAEKSPRQDAEIITAIKLAITDKNTMRPVAVNASTLSLLADLSEHSVQSASQSIEPIAQFFELSRDETLHNIAAQALWNIGEKYPQLRTDVILALQDALQDPHETTRKIGGDAIVSLVDEMEWKDISGNKQTLRNVFEPIAKGESFGHNEARAVLANLRAKEQDHINTLTAQSTASGIKAAR